MRGRVSSMGQFKAWAPSTTTTSPVIISCSGSGRGSLWLGRRSPISTCVGPPIPTIGDDPDETVLLIFKRPAAPYQIRLLKSNHHFDGCTSFAAFVNRSYYCLDCERGFNTNDGTNHTSQGNRCSTYGRFDCRDYVRGTRPTDYCTLCHCKFYGAYCKRHHVVTEQYQSVKTCLKCQAKNTVVPNQRHKFGYAKCPCVTNGCPLMTISVTFNLSQRRRRWTLRNLQKSQRSHGGATPSNIYLCRFRGYAECRGGLCC